MISAWPYGIVDRMRRKGAEGTLYIFNSAGCWSLDESYNRAEYNIMRLADFTKFDAVIADFNNFSVQDEVDEIINSTTRKGDKQDLQIPCQVHKNLHKLTFI